MKAVDTSVIVAAFASWHEAHHTARKALEAHPHLIAHCGLESYSVLTRLPPPHRAPPALVAEFLAQRFPKGVLLLPTTAASKVVTQCAALGIAGGAEYDALIAITARHHGATLQTLDVRACSTYGLLGTAFEPLV